ncbi:hypothetical protein LRP52_48495 [Photobacterium sp. ZSDE20]|nr:hypothetical protein [Photobacterium sp. ZSDE20]
MHPKFDVELFVELMSQGGGGSDYLCQLVMSWRGYNSSYFSEAGQFAISGLHVKLDSTSRQQAIAMLSMDMHDCVFVELEALARKQLGV